MTDTEKRKREKELEAYEKARAAASKHQEKNRKLRERYVDDKKLQGELRELLIADLLRVFEHPANPYRGFAASRQRYRDLGRYPEIMSLDFFGNHQEFQRAAGLHDKRNTSRVKNKSARLHTAQEVARFADENVLRWANRFEKAKGRKGELHGLIGSDFHSVYCDPLALRAWLNSCEMVQPEHVVINGDLVDFPQFSRHRKLPGHFTLNAYQEVEWAREHILRPTREACPNAQIDFILGNHEMRLVNYLADTATELACFPSMSFDVLFGLGELEINLVCRGSFLTPTAKAKAKDVRENWAVYGDSYAATHGRSCAKFAAQVQLDTFKMSGSSGHTHRPQIYHANSLGTGPLSWMSTPMMAHPAVGSDYMPEPTQWNGGFGYFAILPEKSLVSQELVIVHQDWASWAGRTWTPTKAEQKAREAMAI